MEENKYQELFENDDLNNYDFKDIQSMIKRQKKVLKTITKNQEPLLKTSPLRDLLKYQKKKYIIMLCHGGSFSIGIYLKDKCIFHKSDKRYVVRKKAG